jgi:hypothetical protein
MKSARFKNLPITAFIIHLEKAKGSCDHYKVLHGLWNVATNHSSFQMNPVFPDSP